jgi:hypothetical protein
MLGLAVMHLARFLRKLFADIVGIRRQMVAQFLQLGPEFLLLRRDHRHLVRVPVRPALPLRQCRLDTSAAFSGAAAERRRHDCFFDLLRIADRAGHQPALALLVVVTRVAEPDFEIMLPLADERVFDHVGSPTTCRCVGSAIGSMMSKRRPCCSDGTLARAAATRRDRSPQDHAGFGAAFGDNATPRVDDKRVPEGLAAILVQAALRRSQHERAVLDGPRTHQRVPMRFPGLARERRRNREHRSAGFGNGTIERRKAQVITDGQAERANGRSTTTALSPGRKLFDSR